MLQDLILLFLIPTGTRKNFFEIYKQFGNGLSRLFTSPAPSLLVSLPAGRYLLSFRWWAVIGPCTGLTRPRNNKKNKKKKEWKLTRKHQARLHS